MKSIITILALLAVTACDPYGFGFKKNPAYVLDEAFKAISNLDEESFLEVTGREVLCLYGNIDGIMYLRDRVFITPESVKITPKKLHSQHYKSPKFVGYWSYYNERYIVEIQNKSSNETVLETVIDCDYGTDGAKNDRLVNLDVKKYKMKECRLVKAIPKSFAPLPMTQKCSIFKVDL